MLIATAGHVDHGKTLLVKTLTGVDTDRLPEEKRRGLTIDLGFAHIDMTAGRVSFIDVPGHERFIKNMLAGVSAVDLALIVVAADDGVMPQTREHVAILDMLDIRAGMVVINKIDLVEPDRVAVVRRQISELLAGTGLAGAPDFAVSAQQGTGIAELRQALETARAHHAARLSQGAFRLAIDRRFIVEGAGIVVTGTVFSGQVETGQHLILSPGGREVRVRGIRTQDQEAGVARAGERAALNIAGAGLQLDRIQRGQWLVGESAHLPTRRIDVRVKVARDEKRPLQHWTPAHVHIGASDMVCRIALLRDKTLAPGESGLAQLLLERPIGALWGDHFILRDQSAGRTIAGGTVIDPLAPARGRGRPERLASLECLSGSDHGAVLSEMLSQAKTGFDLSSFAAARNIPNDDLAALCQDLDVIAAASGHGFAADCWQDFCAGLLVALSRWHLERPDELGPTEVALHRQLPDRPPLKAVQGAIKELQREGRLLRRGAALHLPDHRAQFTGADAGHWARIEHRLQNAGVRSLRDREIAENLSIELAVLERFLTRAAAMGLIWRVAKNRVYLPHILLPLAQAAEDLALADPEQRFSVAQFRDASDVGRNLAIELLEFFDRAGLTRRAGEGRRVVGSAQEIFAISADQG